MGPSAALVLLNATDVLAPPLNELHSTLALSPAVLVKSQPLSSQRPAQNAPCRVKSRSKKSCNADESLTNNEFLAPLLWRYLELLLDSINVELLKLKLRPVKAFTVNPLSLLNQAAGANVLTLCIFHQTEILLKTGQLTTWKQ